MGLYRSAARRRTGWISESQKQSVARHIGGVRGDFDSRCCSGNFGTNVRIESDQYNNGVVARGFCDPIGKDKEVHARRIDAGGDDCGAGVAEHPFLKAKRIAQTAFDL